jgi:hypothetical protein
MSPWKDALPDPAFAPDLELHLFCPSQIRSESNIMKCAWFRCDLNDRGDGERGGMQKMANIEQAKVSPAN